MAVEDKYVDSNTAAGKLTMAVKSGGAAPVVMVADVAVAAADDDGSVYRLFRALPSNLIPVKMTVYNTAITGGSDYDVGLYKIGVGGAEVDKDILGDGIAMTTARSIDTDNNVGLKTINFANGLKTLGELSAQTDVDPAYDIAITANTAGSAAGSIRAVATFVYA